MSVLKYFPDLKDLVTPDVTSVLDFERITILDHNAGDFDRKEWPSVIFDLKYGKATTLAKLLDQHSQEPTWMGYDAADTYGLNYDWQIAPDFDGDYNLVFRLTVAYDPDYELFFHDRKKWTARLAQDCQTLKALFEPEFEEDMP